MKKNVHNINNPIFFSASYGSQFSGIVSRLLSEVKSTDKSNPQNNTDCIAYVDGDAVIIKRIDRRERWIRHYLNVFENYSGTYDIQGNFTIIFLNNGRHGVSLCGRKDSFDKDVGIAVATARAYGAEIPDYI